MHSDAHIHAVLQHAPDSEWAKFCPRCGCTLEERYLEAEQHRRKICTGCGFIFYLNPKVVAGAIPRQQDRIWLARRNIEPSSGSWTFPAGYVDLGESVPDAAIRETREETLLDIRLDGLLNVYSYADAGVVLVAYCATVIGGVAGITPESREVRDFSIEDIPWTELAFRSTRDALTDYLHFDKTGNKRFAIRR
ncbi:MAG: NUDIX hydrolase [Acidobacteria bacterium]|nr:NUDIX hydrolase [Acidobacteriota bacterium]